MNEERLVRIEQMLEALTAQNKELKRLKDLATNRAIANIKAATATVATSKRLKRTRKKQ